jgi:hypothetical protein
LKSLKSLKGLKSLKSHEKKLLTAAYNLQESQLRRFSRIFGIFFKEFSGNAALFKPETEQLSTTVSNLHAV